MAPASIDDQPNPFAMTRPAGTGRSQVKRSVIVLLAAVIALGGMLIVRQLGGIWLLNRLTKGFDTLTVPGQRERLVQIHELGEPGIPFLAQQLAAPTREVAQTAADLLQRSQNQWVVMEAGQRRKQHQKLIDAIEEVAASLDPSQRRRAKRLVQRTITESVNQPDDDAKLLYSDANELLAILLPESSSPADQIAARPGVPERLRFRRDPLPVQQTISGGQFTDWPPTAEEFGGFPSQQQGDTRNRDGQRNRDQENSNLAVEPAIYGSDAIDSLAKLPSAETIRLKTPPSFVNSPESVTTTSNMMRDQPIETAYSVAGEAPMTQLVDSAMEAYADQSVMYWLNAEHPKLREQAKLELMSRGYGESQIGLAASLAHPDAKVRLSLVDQIVQSPQVDPRPWLWMLVRDSDRDVRFKVLSILATMNEPETRNRLQAAVAEEADPLIATRIRNAIRRR